MSDQQVSLPFVLILLVTIGLATRYFFSSPPPAPAGARGAREATRRREAAADRVLQMFPQADRRAVLWDLARNGGSVQATTERMLAGRLETPPVTFQPRPPPTPTAPAASTPAQKQPARPKQPDLITRYNLQSKLSKAEAEEAKAASEGWSASKEERQTLLKRRRDEMILAARRKMEAKIAEERAREGAAGGVE